VDAGQLLNVAQFFALYAAMQLLSLVSQVESLVTRSTGGPLCRLAVRTAGRTFIAGTGWGGDDIAIGSIRGDAHLIACIRTAAESGTGLERNFALLLSKLLFL
jgi:hypothetical protein